MDQRGADYPKTSGLRESTVSRFVGRNRSLVEGNCTGGYCDGWPRDPHRLASRDEKAARNDKGAHNPEVRAAPLERSIQLTVHGAPGKNP